MDEQQGNMRAALRVAVIGGGAAGLCALRHLTARPKLFQPIAFEKTKTIGGTWVYSDHIGTDEHGQAVHSSMYKNLRTNLPKEVMAFPDLAFPSSLPSFMPHTDVRQYLEDYAHEFDLKKYIQFSTSVEHVHPQETDDGVQWSVTVRGVDEPEEDVRHFTADAIIVCNGHYSDPLMPQIPGLSEFAGRVVHSHNYRDPLEVKNQRVFILGAGASGLDIAMDIAPEAAEVYLGHRKPRVKFPLPSNVHECYGVSRVTPESLLLEDGSEVTVDTIILCTGYHYTYPFLSKTCGLQVEEERVTPLYKHLIHTQFPSLCIIGVCKTICPFPQFDCQIRFFLATLDGSLVLPSKEEMDADTQADYEWRLSRGMPHRHAHHMGVLQWGYNNQIINMAKLTPVPNVVKTLYDHVHDIRTKNLMNYKNYNYRLIDDENFEELH